MLIFRSTLRYLTMVLVMCLTFSFNGPSYSNKPGNPAQSLAFKTDGLYFAEFYDYIYRGHFEHLEVTREDTQFLMIFEQYLRAYGRQNDRFLPTNKVEIMEDVCATEEVTTDAYGTEVSRVCARWKTVGTGLYARPDLYDAKLQVERIQGQDAIRKALGMITDPNAIGNSVDLIHKAKGLRNDMALIFKLNPGDSPGLRRFEENLKKFALCQSSIRMQGASKYTAMKESGGPTGAQNFNQLINDLVADQSRTWAFNRYQAGSIRGVTVGASDGQGRPRELKANYSYKGFGGVSQGWVRVTFDNGLPKCIYFFDFPQNCKTPNSSIVAAYAQGGYGR